ncbi:hypothetical protein [Nocardioides sp. ChNu-99]|uniref:hypothetical protein n=1 Tax=Nocardioides sp. ChNu-99 TaxID=2839897 RepID=UPI0024067B7E|nr:hypothetical protein [Nocardioides sp. ChNu-99]MDF9717641.1 hypothetical protein [Nocardioides sp. ChNu-99]
MSNDEPRTLRDVALAALDRHKGVSGRQLAVIAKGKGLTIVATTINHIAAGTYRSKPSPKTLDALAELSGYTREQVYRVADKPMAMAPLRDVLPPDADLLDGPQREAVIAVIRQFAAAQKALYDREEVGHDAGSAAPTSTTAGGKVIDLPQRDTAATPPADQHDEDDEVAAHDEDFTIEDEQGED